MNRLLERVLRDLLRFLSVLVLLSAGSVRSAEIMVFAAASLTDSLKEIGSLYSRTTGDRVVFNFGSSGTLARQIDEGAPADVFFSADESKMEGLETAGRLVPKSRTSRLSNALAVVAPADSAPTVRSVSDLTNRSVRIIACADPRSVPAGVYWRTHLESLKLWTLIQPKLAPTENVRGALSAVESGNADAALVYKTDALISKKVRVAYEIPKEQGPDIRYSLAMIAESKQPAAARRLMEFIASKDADAVFMRFGFILRQ